MTTLSYPFTLVAGQPENVNQLNSNLAAVATWANGNVDTTNLATSAKPVTILGPYRTIAQTVAEVNGGQVSGTKLVTLTGGPQFSTSPATITDAVPILFLDPADYSVSGLTTKFRVTALIAANATAPGINFTFGLYPVTVAGGALQLVATLGTVVSGSTIAINTPSASTVTTAAGSDFTPPSSGGYTLGVVYSGTTAANAFASVTIALQVHHV